jgi:ABC-type bacteriocin/lantibiotic exporter with double-glycine peptidase domain
VKTTERRGRVVPVLIASVLLATSGCYRGAGTAADPAAISRESGWIRVEVPLVRQSGKSDCGAAALASVLAYHGRGSSLTVIEQRLGDSKRGVRASQLSEYARAQGLAAFTLFATMDDLRYELDQGRPVIVGVAKPYSGQRALTHYQVVIGYEPRGKRLLALDPADGVREYPMDGFLREWDATRRVAIVVMEPPRGDAPRPDERASLSW